MKRFSLIPTIMATLLATKTLAGNLTVNGNLTVTTNLTAQSISLGGVTQTSWPAALAGGYKYVIVAEGTNDLERGNNLQAAYTTATTLNPTSSNRVVVLVPPGSYNLGSSGLTMNTSYVDVIGLVPATMTTKQVFTDTWGIQHTKTVADVHCSVTISGEISASVDDIRIESVVLTGYAPYISGTNTVLRHVEALWMPIDSDCPGQYIDCVGGDNCFASGTSWNPAANASGTFIDCVAGNGSFGGDAQISQGGGNAYGTFIDCTAGDYSFGAASYRVPGVFIGCVAGDESFGGEGATINGTFINCLGGSDCFGGDSGGSLDNAAKLQHCQGGTGSFGSFSMASQDFNYNVGGTNTFLMLPQLPTSTNGLPSGTVYNSSGTLKVMP
ncbi:MAG: hypothetical protein ABSD58_18135 [Verrucomicrobiia bacterium]